MKRQNRGSEVFEGKDDPAKILDRILEEHLKKLSPSEQLKRIKAARIALGHARDDSCAMPPAHCSKTMIPLVTRGHE